MRTRLYLVSLHKKAVVAMDDRQTATGHGVYYWRNFAGGVCGGSLEGILTLSAYFVLRSLITVV